MDERASTHEACPRQADEHLAAERRQPFISTAAVGRWVEQRGLAALLWGLLRGDFRGPASVAVIHWLKQWWRGR